MSDPEDGDYSETEEEVVTFLEYEDMEYPLKPTSVEEQRRCCYALVVIGVAVMCGMISALWVWTTNQDTLKKDSTDSSTMTAIFIGPLVAMGAIIGILITCVIHELKQGTRYYGHVDMDSDVSPEFV